ncbi:MAG: carbohydrate binding domain-containing protein [Clostridia bacterium]|nr:carbohydrate binding domain-containing protein [Clostridia bacterium]
MTKRLFKRMLSVALAVLMLVSLAAPVFAKMGSSDMPWLKDQSLLDQILERDGFIDGIWYPWFNDAYSAHNLSGNEIMAMYYAPDERTAQVWSRVEMDYIGADKIYRQIYNLKAMGYNMMAWGGSIYAEGVKLNPTTGEVLGIKEDYLANARRLLNICREVGMPVVWNVYFHSSAMPHYSGMDGWHIVTRMTADNRVADQYAEKFVRPLCKMLAEYKDVVAMVSLGDEVENEINDPEVGDHFEGNRAMYGTTRENMMYLMRAINNVVKKELPGMPRTIASTGGVNKSFYAELGLDLTGHNTYNNNSHVPELEEFKHIRPAILTEYNVGGDAKESDDELTAQLIKFRENMMKNGYKGGLQWCWISTTTWKQGTSYYLLNSLNPTDFRGTVTDLRHYMDEYRAKYKGKTITVDAAVLYANDGTGLVEWIPSKRGVKMDLLRSNDGGKSWVKVLDNVDQASYVTNKKGSYKDTKTAGSQYKIVVRDAKGNAAESTPNNVAGAESKFVKPMTTNMPAQYGISYVKGTWKMGDRRLISFGVINNRPVNASANLIANGSFETQSGPWTSMLGGMASVVTDKTAPNGGKSLYFNSTGAKSGNFNTKFTVKVQPNTDYVFSTWVKGAYLGTDNLGHSSIGVINPDTGKFLVHTAIKISNGVEKYDASANSYYPRASREDQQIYPTAWDNEWHLRSVMFNSGNLSEITIALYGYGSKMWVDDIALYKNGDGVKYTGVNAQSDLRVNYYSQFYTCADDKCVTKNSGAESAEFWNSGYGWDSGFLSVVSGGKSGKALKYASKAGDGIYYIKWVNVTPNTDYVFTVNAKILKSGEGRIGLLSDSLASPTEAAYLAFDKDVYGGDWVDFCIPFNSSGYTRVGIAICDLGGEALLDNIRLFKKADAQVSQGGNVVGGNIPGGNGGGNGGGNATDPIAPTPTDPIVPDNGTDGENGGSTDNGAADSQDKDNKKDKNNQKDQTASIADFFANLSGPMLLAISFGGTALLIGLVVGIWLIIRAIGKKKKAKAAAAAATAAAATEAPATEAPAEEAADTPAE